MQVIMKVSSGPKVVLHRIIAVFVWSWKQKVKCLRNLEESGGGSIPPGIMYVVLSASP